MLFIFRRINLIKKKTEIIYDSTKLIANCLPFCIHFSSFLLIMFYWLLWFFYLLYILYFLLICLSYFSYFFFSYLALFSLRTLFLFLYFTPPLLMFIDVNLQQMDIFSHIQVLLFLEWHLNLSKIRYYLLSSCKFIKSAVTNCESDKQNYQMLRDLNRTDTLMRFTRVFDKEKIHFCTNVFNKSLFSSKRRVFESKIKANTIKRTSIKSRK